LDQEAADHAQEELNNSREKTDAELDAEIERLHQSMTAVRYTKPLLSLMYVTSVDQI